MRKSYQAELALAGVALIWGTTFVLVKAALADVSTILFLALRFSLAALVLAAVYRRSLQRRGVLPGLAAGSLLIVAYFFQTEGLKLTTASKSAFLTGLSIPMVPLAASLVYRIRPRIPEMAGIVIATLGMALMTLPATGFEPGPGDLLSILCAVTFALHIVLVSHYSPMIGFETIAVVQIATAAVLASTSFRFLEPVRFHMNSVVATAVLVTGLLATAVAFTTMAWAQKYTTATRSALIFALEPVFAWITSWVLTGETLNFRGKAGAGLILAGVVLVEVKRSGATKAKTVAVETNVRSGTSL